MHIVTALVIILIRIDINTASINPRVFYEGLQLFCLTTGNWCWNGELLSQWAYRNPFLMSFFLNMFNLV